MHVSRTVSLFLTTLLIGGMYLPTVLNAETAEELRARINDSQDTIQTLEQEIAKYEKELVEVGKQKQTLQTAVKELDVSRQKVQATITLTSKKIKTTQSTIANLQSSIADREAVISEHKAAIGETLRRMDASETRSLAEIILSEKSLADLWSNNDTLGQFRNTVNARIDALTAEKQSLENQKNESEKQHHVLNSQQASLSSDKHSLDINRQAKNSLLAQTKDKESTYQDILAQKKQEKADFEKKIAEYEAKLKFILDPNSIPAAGKGVLSWPLANVLITQYFGDTEFARSGAYNGKGHNGIDFRAAIGTKVMTSLSGVIVDVNHGVAPNCQYGKWVLVKHGNGLTTLYAHLSDISVSAGEHVVTGQTIGYSGDTGYATAPHLHFTVYASDAVSFINYKCKSGPTVKVPVSAKSGYLNPLDYL